MAHIIDRLTDKFPWLRNAAGLQIPDDLRVGAVSLRFTPGSEQLEYLCFQVQEREGSQMYTGYRVVRLLQLKYISLEARRDAGLLQKMRTVLRGLYGSQVDLVYLAAGIFEQPRAGIVQCYGVSAFSADMNEAVRRSAEMLMALKAAMTGAYRQMRLEPLTPLVAQWIAGAFTQMRFALVTVGHPDPRENARGGDPSLRDPLTAAQSGAQQYAMQQNELLFRGMSGLQEEFLLLVLASHVQLEDITRMLAGLLEETSVYASRQAGARAASFGVSLPAILTGGLAENASRTYSASQSSGHTAGTAATDGVAQATGQAHTVGHASTSGWAHTVGVTETDTSGSASTHGTAVSHGTAHTEGSAVTDGSSHTQSSGVAVSHIDSAGYGASGGLGGSIAPAGVGVSANLGGSANWGSADGVTSSSGSANSTMHSVTSSSSDTVSNSVTQSRSTTNSHSHSTSQSESWSTSGSETNSVADTTSSSSSQSHADTRSRADSQSQGVNAGQALGRGLSAGMSVGVAPSFSLSNSFQWQDDPNILLTEIMRTQRKLLDVAGREGAFYTDVYALARSQQGAQALMGLIPEAFHGTEDVVAGVQTRSLSEEEQAYISLHARTFTPSTRVETVPEAMSGYANSTLLTMLQLAAYTAPGTFEQGPALTIQEETPSFAFYPEMPGDLTLGRQWSTETGRLTDVFLHLEQGRHFHTAFVGDTGFGKSVAAERLAYETTRYWRYRTIILDFGQGWRKALRWPGLIEREPGRSQVHVDIRQLYPSAPRPLRWNILQVPQRFDPGRYRSMLCELFANAGRMGPRQLGLMRRALTEIYTEAGVLTGDPKVQRGERGRVLNFAERDAVRQARLALNLPEEDVAVGTPLEQLCAPELQALAVLRSSALSVVDWVERLRSYMKAFERDQSSRTSLEGVLLRLEQFAEGAMARQYGPGQSAEPVEDLGLLGEGDDRWGATVIEGGAEMDEYPKAALLSLLSSILYFDAVARRREALDSDRPFPKMQIFFEEANKVLSGVSGGAASDQAASESGSPVSHIFQTMWRDGRKYGVYLHLMAQTAAELPSGILSSCANLFVFQTKDPKDRDLILPHLGRSEKGMVNTEYKRYLARIPRTYAIAKLGYSADVHELEPALIRPMLVACDEPSDSDILQELGPASDALYS